MKYSTQPKPKDWEIPQKRQGTTLVDESIAWQREYYLVATFISDTETKFTVKHYQDVNDLLKDLDAKSITYRWWGCPNRQYAVDVKDRFENSGIILS